jgi:hypothetical protein
MMLLYGTQAQYGAHITVLRYGTRTLQYSTRAVLAPAWKCLVYLLLINVKHGTIIIRSWLASRAEILPVAINIASFFCCFGCLVFCFVYFKTPFKSLVRLRFPPLAFTPNCATAFIVKEKLDPKVRDRQGQTETDRAR